MPDELFWRSTPAEVTELLKEIGEMEHRREKAAALRAGLVASAIYNVHRKKGTRPVKPSDFVRGAKRRMSVEEAKKHLTALSTRLSKNEA